MTEEGWLLSLLCVLVAILFAFLERVGLVLVFLYLAGVSYHNWEAREKQKQERTA